MRQVAVLVLLVVTLCRSDEQGRQFPPGVIVDPQFYDQPNYNEGPLERPPQFGGRPPQGGRPHYGNDPYAGRPPFDQKQGYRPRPYKPTPPTPAGYRPGPPPPGYGGPYPQPGYNDPGFGGGFNPMGSFSNALESIAKHDEKQCVARMVCELSAGGRPGSGYYRGSGGLFDLSGLSGVVDLLGAMTASSAASPMLTFGRAALLGATMRDPYRCYRSFPNCPRDPDRLVDYLNNHNGGFFRLFEPTPTAPSASSYNTKRPYYYNRTGKKLEDAEHKEQRESEQGDSSNLVNPRIVNDAPPVIADRTGTGDLRLDSEQLQNSAPLRNEVRGARTLNFFPSSKSKDGSHDSRQSLTFPKA
ncbi:Hypothetical predicted protein [Cloeon dipterum]|uniref:Uncharacterized protein n=1 Tax=Cloeon dipterum TaxID=197152 RepID=A0A8S1C3T4_9INSE|nr:Hypothetical predicted protein [Cloeon dipterum]